MTIKDNYNEMMAEHKSKCSHIFVDAYDAVKYEVYIRCARCGLERDRRSMSQEDAERFLGVMNNLSAKGDKKRLGEQLHLNLDPDNG